MRTVFLPTISGLWNLKLLTPLVTGIGDVEMAVVIESHAVRVGELAGITAGASETEQEFAVGCEALHAIVQAADPTLFRFLNSLLVE